VHLHHPITPRALRQILVERPTSVDQVNDPAASSGAARRRRPLTIVLNTRTLVLGIDPEWRQR